MSSSDLADLSVSPDSAALSGCHIDYIVTGSIGAIEAPRFIRALRRLGAHVQPWLTRSGADFITPTSLEWAANQEVRTTFSGAQTHTATGDLCVVAPATTHALSKIAWGDTDTPTSALITSYLGMQKKVLVLPSMHDSLWNAPTTQRNIDTIQEAQKYVHFLQNRQEEGKQKMPLPVEFANQVAHEYHRRDERVLITMGTTRGYIDDVRYITNYSSGALGSAICEELYRYGLQLEVVCGPCPIQPRITTPLHNVETHTQMLSAVQALTGYDAAVCVASVLDYAPENSQAGKIASTQKSLTIECLPTEKIIAHIKPQKSIKVGFKLQSKVNAQNPEELWQVYRERYNLSSIVVNNKEDVDAHKHAAIMFSSTDKPIELNDKAAIARQISQHIRTEL